MDEAELEDELADLEQEQLDNKMLKTGSVPVSDEVHRLPSVVNGEGKSSKNITLLCLKLLIFDFSQSQSTCSRGRG